MTKDERIASFKRIANECVTNEGATDDDLIEIMERKSPSTRAGQCVHACLGEAIGVVRIYFFN